MKKKGKEKNGKKSSLFFAMEMNSGLCDDVRRLAIYSQLDKIGEMIGGADRCAIVAATGSGKSLGVPLYMAMKGFTVWVSVPTITAARSLQMRQIELIQMSKLNILVGYAAEGERYYDHTCKIVYATSGHWRRKFLNFHHSKNTWHIPTSVPDIFMLDEIHIGSMDNDIIMATLDTMMAETPVKIKLVLATATYDSLRFPDIPKCEIVVKSFPIEDQYHSRNYSLTEEKELYPDIVKLVADFHDDDPFNRLGDILVFVPGAGEVEMMVESIKSAICLKEGTVDEDEKRYGDDEDSDHEPETAIVLPAYSKLPRDILDTIYKPSALRKIIVATNVAETSITIPGVGIIVDSLLERAAGTSANGGKSLATQKIYKDSAMQRRGRTGRDRQGICYRMCSEDTYELMEPTKLREMLRVPLHDMILELISYHFDPKIFLKDYVDVERIIAAINLLIRLEILESATKSHEEYRITPIANFIRCFPLSVRNGAFLYNWHQQKHDMYQGIVIVSLIECFGPSYIWWPNEKKTHHMDVAAFKQKAIKLYGATNELASQSKIYSRMMSKCGGLYRESWVYNQYCRENSLNDKKIYELLRCIRQCLDSCPQSDYVLGKFSDEEIVTKAIPILAKTNPDKLYTYYSHKKYRTEEGLVFTLDDKRTLATPNTSVVISLAEFELKLPTYTLNLISIGLPFDKLKYEQKTKPASDAWQTV